MGPRPQRGVFVAGAAAAAVLTAVLLLRGWLAASPDEQQQLQLPQQGPTSAPHLARQHSTLLAEAQRRRAEMLRRHETQQSLAEDSGGDGPRAGRDRSVSALDAAAEAAAHQQPTVTPRDAAGSGGGGLYCGFRQQDMTPAAGRPEWDLLDWPVDAAQRQRVYPSGFPLLGDVFVDRRGRWLYLVAIPAHRCTADNATLANPTAWCTQLRCTFRRRGAGGGAALEVLSERVRQQSNRRDVQLMRCAVPAALRPLVVSAFLTTEVTLDLTWPEQSLAHVNTNYLDPRQPCLGKPAQPVFSSPPQLVGIPVCGHLWRSPEDTIVPLAEEGVVGEEGEGRKVADAAGEAAEAGGGAEAGDETGMTAGGAEVGGDPTLDKDAERLRRPYFLSAFTHVSVSRDRGNVHKLYEWIEYYLLVGVEHFFVYSYDFERHGRTEQALRPYIDAGLVTLVWFPLTGCPERNREHYVLFHQFQAENSCFKRYGSYTRWMLYTDIDEFMVFRNVREGRGRGLGGAVGGAVPLQGGANAAYATLPDMLRAEEFRDLVAVSYKPQMFVPCNGTVLTAADILQTQRNLCNTKFYYADTKMIFRPALVFRSYVHWVATLWSPQSVSSVARELDPEREGFLAHYRSAYDLQRGSTWLNCGAELPGGTKVCHKRWPDPARLGTPIRNHADPQHMREPQWFGGALGRELRRRVEQAEAQA